MWYLALTSRFNFKRIIASTELETKKGHSLLTLRRVDKSISLSNRIFQGFKIFEVN